MYLYFTSYIALEERQRLVDDLTRAKFFSLQVDGSTDCGNIEDELFLVVFLDYQAAGYESGTSFSLSEDHIKEMPGVCMSAWSKLSSSWGLLMSGK